MDTMTKLFAGYSIGTDAYGEVDGFCSPFGTNVLLIGGATGLAKGKPRLEAAFLKTRSRLVLKDTVVYGKECTYERIGELTALYQNSGVDMVFGMGGGKAMDTAKGVAFRLGVPVFTFPTIPSNCAAMAALSVVYKMSGGFDSFYFYDRPAVHCFIDTALLIHAPYKYFRAGMADTIAKYFECHFSARGDELDYHSALGREISRLCYERISTCGVRAAKEFEQEKPGEGFNQTVLTIIVNTGLVSHLVEDCYNCAVAHSVCYGLDLLPGINARFLHGDLVGYGVLIQLALDQLQGKGGEPETTFLEVRELLSDLKVPVSLGDMEIPWDKRKLEAVLTETVNGPDMEHIPYLINEDMVWRAMDWVERQDQKAK